MADHNRRRSLPSHDVPSYDEEPHDGEEIAAPAYGGGSRPLDVDRACSRVARIESEEANENLTKLHVIMKAILDDREGLSREAQATLKHWIEEVFDCLETVHNPGFNYHYEPNRIKIEKHFKNLSQARDRRGNPIAIVERDTIVKNCRIKQIMEKLKLKTPYEGQELEVQTVIQDIGDLVVPNVNHLEAMSLFNVWSYEILKKVRSDRKNLDDPRRARRILVILNYIGQTTERQTEEEPAVQGRKANYARLLRRAQLFVESHEATGVLAAMEIMDAPAYSETEAPTSRWHRIRRRFNVNPGSSSQASLTHARRLGKRQIEMRGLVPLGTAEDGGYYF